MKMDIVGMSLKKMLGQESEINVVNFKHNSLEKIIKKMRNL